MLNIVHVLKYCESKGIDDISPIIVKDVITVILNLLSYVFITSFLLGQFRKQMKNFKVAQVYKSDDKSAVNYYRS